jgi:hypothetical protein
MKRQAMDWDKILSVCIADKEFEFITSKRI